MGIGEMADSNRGNEDTLLIQTETEQVTSTKEKPRNIGVVTIPISEAGNISLTNLIDILRALFSNIYVITGNRGRVLSKKGGGRTHLFKIRHKSGANIFTRIINYVWMQLKISYNLAKLRRKVDLWVFFIGGEGLVLPVLTTKLLRKNVVIASAGSGLKVAQAQDDPLARSVDLMQNITYRLSDRIIMYSERLVEEHGLQRYRSKISIAHQHFLDFDKFKIQKRLSERGNFIGYIGALSKAKGIPNLLEAIPKVLKREDRIEFLIGGDGELRSEIEEYSSRKNLNGKVNFVGWIPHDELPKYLNNLKLLVLPSYTEGLPNIILEAMACGTPVLTTPVGGILDVIKDGETGFIMEDNSPECITKGVIRAVEHPESDEINRNARSCIEQKYTYEAAVESWRGMKL